MVGTRRGPQRIAVQRRAPLRYPIPTSPHLRCLCQEDDIPPVAIQVSFTVERSSTSNSNLSRYCPASRATACIVADAVTLTASSSSPNVGDVGRRAPRPKPHLSSLQCQCPATSPHQASVLAQSATSLMHPQPTPTFFQPILLTLSSYSTTLLRTAIHPYPQSSDDRCPRLP